MDVMDVIRSRHSVRQFDNRALDQKTKDLLDQEIEACNRESGFHLQLITDEPEAFEAGKTSYGKFQGCRNYLNIIGPKNREEDAGYFAEKIVLKAQELNVNSCWVALTYKKGKAKGIVFPGEKSYMVVALGYGLNNGVPHKGKSIEDISDYKDGDPEWYKKGLEAAILAPTAMNQQKFYFTRHDDKVTAKIAGLGVHTRVDLGIVKCHFELGSGKDRNIWR